MKPDNQRANLGARRALACLVPACLVVTHAALSAGTIEIPTAPPTDATAVEIPVATATRCGILHGYMPFVVMPRDPNPPPPTATPTGQPSQPQLSAPEDCVVLPQPVAPNAWAFSWAGCSPDSCRYAIEITGPGGRRIAQSNILAFSYIYTTTSYLPTDALGPWYWRVGVNRNGNSKHSELRSFWVAPAPTVLSFTGTPTITPTPTGTPSSAPGE